MSQLSKNTVKGTSQLKDTDFVNFLNDYDESNVKILFVGNSITLHGILPEIGWNHCFGMAASSRENDYVHVCMKEIQKVWFIAHSTKIRILFILTKRFLKHCNDFVFT